jgi:hypothetical protein
MRSGVQVIKMCKVHAWFFFLFPSIVGAKCPFGLNMLKDLVPRGLI